jgi:hypothetical protein
MVLAIAIAGLIFASAIIPTTQAVVAYQEAEARVRAATLQATAAVRAEQIAAAVWRDAAPPDDHDALQKAKAAELQVGDWALREQSQRLEQKRKSAAWTSIAEPVDSFTFTYLLTDGSWSASVPDAHLDDVLAIRFEWNNPDNGRPHSGLILVPDQAFSANLIDLPDPEVSNPYKREDYEQTVRLSLGSWE